MGRMYSVESFFCDNMKRCLLTEISCEIEKRFYRGFIRGYSVNRGKQQCRTRALFPFTWIKN